MNDLSGERPGGSIKLCSHFKSDGERDPRVPVMCPNVGARRLLS